MIADLKPYPGRVATRELQIPRQKWNSVRFLEILEKHGQG